MKKIIKKQNDQKKSEEIILKKMTTRDFKKNPQPKMN